MTTPYQGGHRGTSPDRRSAQGPQSAQGRTLQRRRVSRALHRPLTSAAAIVVVAGASAAGFAAAAKPHTSAALTSSPDEARRSAERADARAKQQELAAHAHAAASARVRSALDLARRAAAERASRERTRQSILGRAQSDPRGVARLMVAEKGWGGEQFSCLDSLWAKESGWNWKADNSSSGAYGIPQSLPGSKMASVAGDWATNPVTQIKWGLNYIANSYGTPCSAWMHSKGSNWY